MAGGEEGVTAFQMDIKVEGITIGVMERALAQAREGRLHILGEGGGGGERIGNGCAIT